MRDPYKYHISSYPGLYNLAWAQAVNNKPLGDVLVTMEDGSNGHSNSDNDPSKVVTDVNDDGELEEGEIDLDSELHESDVKANKEDRSKSVDVDLIMEELVNLKAPDAQNSIDAFFPRLEATAVKLHKIMLEGPFPEKDTLVQLLLQTLLSVFSSMSLALKQQNEAILFRLLAQLTSLRPPLFSSLQLKEVEAIKLSLESSDNSLSNGATGMKQVREGFNTTDLHVLFENADNRPDYVRKHGQEPVPDGSVDQRGQSFPLQCSKSGLVNLRRKGLPLPLLDLHRDHDADSLPSPTRDHSATFPFDKGLILEQGLLKPEWPLPRQALPRGNPALHPYETDTVKDVSSYRQKFGQGSCFVNDKFPSPTPSGEGENKGDGEACGEVSSSVNHNVNPSVNSLMLGQPALSSAAARDVIAGPEISNVRMIDTANSFRNPVLEPSAKSRDPRLRMANSDAGPTNLSQSLPSMGSDESKSTHVGVMSSRKQKISEELVLNGPALKRRKNESLIPEVTLPLTTTISTSQVLTPPVLPIRSLTKSALTCQTEILPVKSFSSSSPIHSLLRDIAGNPSIWMSILKMEHKTSGDNNNATQIPNSNSILGVAPSTSGVLPSSSILGQKPAGIVPCQPVSAVGTYIYIFLVPLNLLNLSYY